MRLILKRHRITRPTKLCFFRRSAVYFPFPLCYAVGVMYTKYTQETGGIPLMRNILRISLSLLLTLSLLFATAVSAAASEALGEDLTSRDTAIHQSTLLSKNVFWSTSFSDLRTENLVTYQPNSSVTPIVTYGNTLTSCNTLSSMASTLEAQGYRVVAGINGDFFNFSTGLPIGLVISAGELKSSDGGYYAIGFKSDGSAVMGKPGLKTSADLGYAAADSSGYSTEVVRSVTGVNKARVSTGGIYLYTYDFNAKHTTGNTEPGVDVVCNIMDGSLSIGGTLTLQVAKVVEASSATVIGQGQVVLSVNSLSSEYFVNALKNETVGNTVTVSVSASDSQWNDVQYGVGALYSLVENGTVVSSLPTGASPRTAVGVKSDGTLVFYTIDGRRAGYSIGATMSQVGQRLIELGCTSALCLDGGGSTTLTVTQPDSTNSATINKPSDGSERSVSNQIFLVASGSSTGVLDHFYVSADNDYVLAGSAVNISAAAVDTNYIPMSAQPYSLSSSGGTLSGDVLTTPAEGGDVTVTASVSGKSGSAIVHAVKTPDSISLKTGSTAVTSLTVTPGSTTSLTASAVYNHQALKADAAAFTWTASGGIGSVDSSGKFTAAQPGTGSLTVSAGGKSITVPVTVSKVALSTIENFEKGVGTFTNDGAGIIPSACTDTEYVRYGTGSLKLDYSGLDVSGNLATGATYAVNTPYTLLNFWVYGDGSGNTLSVLTSDGSAVSAVEAVTLDFTGWKQVSVSLPSGVSAITGMSITGTPTVNTDSQTGVITVTYPHSSGTIYLDQLVASYGTNVDSTAPSVTASVSGTTLTASVSDATDGVLAKSAVGVTLDGKSVSFTYNTASGSLTAALPVSDTNGHRVTVTAKDASGNIGRASCDIAASGESRQFTDIDGYWAADYVDWLKTAGITTGYSDGTFRPGKNITRQEFAVMLYRYLGLDGAGYDTVALPFADSDKISDYAVTAVKALYSKGIINGSTGSDGKLYFSPDSNLKRSQAAAMIGRTQPKGYAAASLNFTDAASIPSYAAYYIQTMVAQGVIGGYADGTFRPGTNITRGQMAKILYNLL